MAGKHSLFNIIMGTYIIFSSFFYFKRAYDIFSVNYQLHYPGYNVDEINSILGAGFKHPLYCDPAKENQEDLKEKTLNLSVALGAMSFFTLCGGVAWISKKENTE